jgi:hypothetical protein
MTAYDFADGMVVLFGGEYGTDATFVDTWSYWAGGWSSVTPPTKVQAGWNPPANESGPSGRQAAAMAYDARDGFPILFGGFNETAYTKAVNYSDTWILTAGVWNLTTGSGPSARYGASMVYDSADSYVLLFGGWQISQSGTTALRDTWDYTFANGWKQLHPSSSPVGRGGAAMTFDSTSGKVILFGGANISGSTIKSLCDTWGFTGGSWTKDTAASCPTSGPVGRSNASFAYYPAGGYDVLFGGFNWTDGTFLGDSWRFSSGTWTKITSSSPSARADATLISDGVDGYLVLFGGQAPTCYSGTTARCMQLGDTWKFMSGIWTNITSSLGSGPARRSEAAATYDAASRYTLMFGGIYAPVRTSPVSASDEWTYWTSGWQMIHSTLSYLSYAAPGERSEEALAYNGPTRSVLMYGGMGKLVTRTNCTSYNQNLSDTWSFVDGYGTNVTTRVGNFQPTPLFGASMVYDQRDGYVVLFGGVTQRGFNHYPDVNCPIFVPVAYTWIFVNSQWSNITPSPSPSARNYFGMVYDPVDQYVLLFGGKNKAGDDLQDTWAFMGGQWENLTSLITNPPLARDSMDMVFDASDGYVLMWGGYEQGLMYGNTPCSKSLNYTCWGQDTWTYQHTSWTELTPLNHKFPHWTQFQSAMFYVPDRQAVFMFGGAECSWPASGNACNATWEYHGDVWTNVTTWFYSSRLSYPPVIIEQTMTTDYGSETGFMFGGFNPVGTSEYTSNTGWYLT